MKLLITDLDNTLYDWVTYFARSFDAMVESLSTLLAIGKEQLCHEFKQVHQFYGDSELPFAILELPSVRRLYPAHTPIELLHDLDESLYAFNSARKRYLKLYESVEDTLSQLQRDGVLVVGHTEASVINAYYRMTKLGIEKYFHHLYAIDGVPSRHPDPNRKVAQEPPQGFVSLVPRTERKPNPALLKDICDRENVPIHHTVYVGDSITRDISMAKQAGVVSVWARYGTQYDPAVWNNLVKITHWTDEDVAREVKLKQLHSSVNPDYIIDSFGALINIFHDLDRNPHMDSKN